MNGATTPVRTNFVNPSADTNRRIGMPQQPGGGAIQNRGAYKPPAPAGHVQGNSGNVQATGNGNPNQGLKRPPLSDVSNLQGQVDGSAEVKKARVEPGGEENAEALVEGS